MRKSSPLHFPVTQQWPGRETQHLNKVPFKKRFFIIHLLIIIIFCYANSSTLQCQLSPANWWPQMHESWAPSPLSTSRVDISCLPPRCWCLPDTLSSLEPSDIPLLPPSMPNHSLNCLLPLHCLGLIFPVPRANAETCPFLFRLCLFPGPGLGEDLGNFPASSGPSPHQHGTWHPAPSMWYGQREEQFPFPRPLSRGFSFPALWPPLPWNLGRFPVGFQLLGCEDPDPHLRTQNGKKQLDSCWCGDKRRGCPLQTPHCLQRSLAFGKGVRPLCHLCRVPLLLRGSTIFCRDRSQRICCCEAWWCEQNSACLTFAKWTLLI